MGTLFPKIIISRSLAARRQKAQDALRGGETCSANEGGLVRNATMRSFEIYVMSGKDPLLGVDVKLEPLGAVPLRKNSALMSEDFSVQ